MIYVKPYERPVEYIKEMTSMTQKINEADRWFDRRDFRETASHWHGRSVHGMVCAAHYRAAQAGAEALRRGGNAVDGAAAASLALAVVEPAASGLGGMALMLVYEAKNDRVFLIEGPCRAPVAATPEAVSQLHRKEGYGAVAVPTYAAVIDYALRHYGTMSWAQAAEGAISLAEDGYQLTPFQHSLQNTYRKALLRGNAGRMFLNEQGFPPEVGTVMRNPALGRTLRRLAEGGAGEFYQGQVARRIVEDMASRGGFVTAEDFKTIPEPTESEPLRGTYRDWNIYTNAPPGGGFVILEMFNLLEASTTPDWDPDQPNGAALLAEIIRRARQDRIRQRLKLTRKWTFGEADILSKSYAQEQADQILQRLSGTGETTHLNVIDRQGNIVALTQSIERSFGAKVATEDLGFLYNGFLSGFKLINKRHPHYLQPGAVARSNACPTFVRRANGEFYTIGSSGSERAASGVFQVLLRLQKQGAFEAVQAPRLHCTPDNVVICEAERFDREVLEYLSRLGFQITPFGESWAFSAGGLHLAGRDASGSWGVADPRRDGWATGPDSIDWRN